MAQEWYKVDNVAKVFLATNTRRDPRVFRISSARMSKSVCWVRSPEPPMG